MGLSFKYDELYNKTEKICNENGFDFDFFVTGFPIKAFVTPEYNHVEQVELFDKTKEKIKGKITIIFDEEIEIKTTGDIKIEDDAFNKIKRSCNKLYIAYLALYFQNSMSWSGIKENT